MKNFVRQYPYSLLGMAWLCMNSCAEISGTRVLDATIQAANPIDSGALVDRGLSGNDTGFNNGNDASASKDGGSETPDAPLFQSCTLLSPLNNCADGEECYVIDQRGTTVCLSEGTALENDPCVNPNDCASNLVCIGSSNSRCVRLCRLEGTECPGNCRSISFLPGSFGICG